MRKKLHVWNRGYVLGNVRIGCYGIWKEIITLNLDYRKTQKT